MDTRIVSIGVYQKRSSAKNTLISTLNQHNELVHEGKRPHKCEICNKGFCYKKDFKKHTDSVHERKRPYQCSTCNGKFTVKSKPAQKLIVIRIWGGVLNISVSKMLVFLRFLEVLEDLEMSGRLGRNTSFYARRNPNSWC